MKRNLLLVLFALTYTFAQAQVVFYIQPPSPLEGSYTITYADGTDWGVSDLTDPANAVLAEMAMALDGSATADSLVCEPPVISDVDGKVAVLYRGVCEFGAKALACQEAGAVAVVIITYADQEPVGMGGGAVGVDVTIPVVMITRIAGESLRPAIEAGGLFVFIGNKTGYFDNDLGIKPNGVIRAPQSSSLQLLSQDASEFAPDLGVWVTNFGINDQTDVVLSAEITFDGNSVYSESADPISILSGDSALVLLPAFSQTSYDVGKYELVYTVSSGSPDDFPSDDMFDAPFNMSDSLFSYANIPTEAEGPDNITFYRPSTSDGEIQQCVAFKDPNASRVGVKGITFAATTTNGVAIDGEVISVYAYEWTLQFEDLLDPDFTGVDEIDLDLLTSGVYEYVGEDMDGVNVYAPFEETILLDDDARYLFCIGYESEDIFTGYNSSKLDYLTTQDNYLQPVFPNSSGTEWFTNGYGTEICPGIAVHFFDANANSVEEVGNVIELTPYPNPAQDLVQIPMKNVSGLTTIQIFDVAGKLVETQSVNVTAGEVLQVNVSNLDRGVYTFGLRYENGDVSNFNVVISK
jgi:hypothetical protein